jgi:hypothetical protein
MIEPSKFKINGHLKKAFFVGDEISCPTPGCRISKSCYMLISHIIQSVSQALFLNGGHHPHAKRHHLHKWLGELPVDEIGGEKEYIEKGLQEFQAARWH